jgi:hypothetical protein
MSTALLTGLATEMLLAERVFTSNNQHRGVPKIMRKKSHTGVPLYPWAIHSKTLLTYLLTPWSTVPLEKLTSLHS